MQSWRIQSFTITEYCDSFLERKKKIEKIKEASSISTRLWKLCRVCHCSSLLKTSPQYKQGGKNWKPQPEKSAPRTPVSVHRWTALGRSAEVWDWWKLCQISPGGSWDWWRMCQKTPCGLRKSPLTLLLLLLLRVQRPRCCLPSTALSPTCRELQRGMKRSCCELCKASLSLRISCTQRTHHEWINITHKQSPKLGTDPWRSDAPSQFKATLLVKLTAERLWWEIPFPAQKA